MTKLINTNTQNNILLFDKEDIPVIKTIDAVFVGKRGYVIKMPEKGSSVVSCMSGGLDSIINTAILLKEFHYDVYPYFINRNQTNYKWEKKSVDFFNDYFKRNFPESYHDYLEIKLPSPPSEYKDSLRTVKNSSSHDRIGYPARNPLISLVGMEYAHSLKSKNVSVNTVFLSFMNGDPMLHSTLTATRALNLQMCLILGNWDFQLISIPKEVCLGNYYGKDVYIKWAYENNIPVENTRSCYKNTKLHCGRCSPACTERKRAFAQAGVPDPTKYLF